MIYAIGYHEPVEQGEHKFILKKNIKKEEYDHHLSSLDEATKLKVMSNIYNLFERNGKEFLNYTAEIPVYLKSNEDKDSIYLEANRLLINYLSSLSMFIDYGEKLNKKYFGKQKMGEFVDKTHKLYDSFVSYRFMALMRNYALHYGFPLTHIKRSLTQKSGIFASKQTLLKFKSWKHAKEDIEKMPEDIVLEPHVKVSMLLIEHLYQSYIYDIAPSVINGVEYINKMIKESGGKVPILATFKNIDEFKKGNFLINYIEPKPYLDSLKIIESHPSINIEIVDNN